MLESAIEDFPLYKQELKQVEATIFNNIAACCKKELNSKMEVEYTTKVIEMTEYLTDKNVILKAFLRRGLAYETLEKFLQAKEDMLTVKQLQFDNKQASQCLSRCSKAIKDIYGTAVPESKPNAPVKLAVDTSLFTTTSTSTPSEDLKIVKEEEDKMSVSELNTEFARIKEEGNTEFKAKSFMMAASKFTEGINIYLKNKDSCESDTELNTKVI